MVLIGIDPYKNLWFFQFFQDESPFRWIAKDQRDQVQEAHAGRGVGLLILPGLETDGMVEVQLMYVCIYIYSAYIYIYIYVYTCVSKNIIVYLWNIIILQ